MDMLTDNPCRGVIPSKENAVEKEYYTLKEVEKLFELFKGEPLKYQVFFNLAIYSGFRSRLQQSQKNMKISNLAIYSAFRRGELLGLEWEDI
ncbi:MAG TPA: hypothetical protein PLF24_06350 [Ruminococcus sp.]|nr:hypothetical protein [Ruminococcus sp.]